MCIPYVRFYAASPAYHSKHQIHRHLPQTRYLVELAPSRSYLSELRLWPRKSLCHPLGQGKTAFALYLRVFKSASAYPSAHSPADGPYTQIILTLADAHALIQRHNNVRSIALLENEEIQRLAKKPSNIRNVFLLAPGREQTLQESIHFRSVAVHHSLAKDCQTTIPWHFHGKTLHRQLADWQLSRITQKTDGSDFVVNLLQTDMIEAQSNNKKDPLPADGALVVVNCRSAVTSQVEVTLKQFLTANIRPVLFIDGLTEAIKNDQLPKEELYQSLQSTIDNMNQLIRRLESKKEIGFFLAPQDADVAFGSAAGWAFTIDTFARRFAKKFASDPSTMSRRLWVWKLSLKLPCIGLRP